MKRNIIFYSIFLSGDDLTFFSPSKFKRVILIRIQIIFCSEKGCSLATWLNLSINSQVTLNVIVERLHHKSFISLRFYDFEILIVILVFVVW